MRAAFLAFLFLAAQPVCSLTLRGKTVSIAVPFEADASGTAILHLDGVQIDKPPGGYYEVQVAGELAGNLTFYGVTPAMNRDLTYRVSGAVRRTRKGDVTVTFVPRGGAARSDARVRIRAIRIANS
jgi:hypothetical protein